MNKEKLLEKVANFAGFEDVGPRDKFRRIPGIKYPDGSLYSSYPNFLEDETACFKWLAPKIEPKTLIIESYIEDEVMKFSVAILSEKESGGLWCGNHKNLALALCLAIEKLIDESVSSET